MNPHSKKRNQTGQGICASSQKFLVKPMDMDLGFVLCVCCYECFCFSCLSVSVCRHIIEATELGAEVQVLVV